MNNQTRFIITYITSLLIGACSSPPALKNVGKDAPEHPINQPEQAKLIKEKYSQ